MKRRHSDPTEQLLFSRYSVAMAGIPRPLMLVVVVLAIAAAPLFLVAWWLGLIVGVAALAIGSAGWWYLPWRRGYEQGGRAPGAARGEAPAARAAMSLGT